MCCLFGVEKIIVCNYICAINKTPLCCCQANCKKGKRCFLRKICICKIWKGNTTSKGNNVRNIRVNRGSADEYEKLYRCYIDSLRVRLTRWVIIAVAVVLNATIICCAFGPNFRNQENTNAATTTTSSNTVVVGGYAGRGSYGYTYFQESKNGRR